MGRCCDFPCCGHENGCCPDFDESGNQLNMVCVCGKKLPINSRYSCCEACMDADGDSDGFYLDRGDWRDNEDDWTEEQELEDEWGDEPDGGDWGFGGE